MLRALAVCVIVLSLVAAAFADEKADRAAIDRTSEAVRAAFARGECEDVAEVIRRFGAGPLPRE